jgi:hypothetical protein
VRQALVAAAMLCGAVLVTAKPAPATEPSVFFGPNRVGRMLDFRENVDRGVDFTGARREVVRFFTGLDGGTNAPIPQNLRGQFTASTWRELKAQYIDPNTHLLSAQIIDVYRAGGRDTFELSVVVTGLTNGSPFVNEAKLRFKHEPPDGWLLVSAEFLPTQ